MTRETRKIKLSNCEVEIITFLTWGEKERVQAEIMKGTKVSQSGFDGFDMSSMFEAKVKLIEIAVKGIVKDEVVSQFSREWLENLSPEDGDLLHEEIDKMNKKKV